MRRFIGALTILLLAVPAMAGITVECSQVGDTNVVELTYAMDGGDSNLPRAFAIDVSLSVANAGNVAPYDLSADFYVAPGSYSYNSGTGAVDWGNPIISATPTGFTIEMGSLWASNDPCHTVAPGPSGPLLRFIVENECDVTLEENAARAGVDSNGVVMQDTSLSYPAGYVTLIGETVSFTPPDCFFVGMVDSAGHTVVQAEYDRWVSLGKPCCWCYNCHPQGDVDGNCTVNPDDVTEAAAGWISYPTGYCSDTDYNGSVNPDDITAIADGWINGCPGACVPLGPEPDGCDPFANS